MLLLRPPLARLLLVVAALAAAAVIAWRGPARRISTDVLDLVPAGERDPALALVRSLASERHARVVLLALQFPDTADTAARGRAAAAFLAALRAAPAVAEVAALDDPSSRDGLGREVFQRRLDLLLPGWLAARAAEHARTAPAAAFAPWLAERVAADLETFLARPEALALPELLPQDPLLLLPDLLPQAGAFAAPGAADRALFWALAAQPPLGEEGQRGIRAAVDTALAAARVEFSGTELQWTAVSRFAAESRRRIEREVLGLNLVSVVAVLAIAFACLPSLLRALQLVPVVAGALLAAWSATLLVFDRVHVLVFAVGALLAGVAIDYGFYLYLQPSNTAAEPYETKVRRLLKPLLASALTTILGFSLLLCADLPLLRQLGVFVGAGLLGALATALLWFAQLRRPNLAVRPFVERPLVPTGPAARRVALGLVALGAAVALAGPWRLKWRDDIRQLDIAAPALHAEDRLVRDLSGDSRDRTLYLSFGADLAEARAAQERFRQWHHATAPEVAAFGLGLVLPTAAEWTALAEHRAALAAFAPALRTALDRHGFEADGFAPFFATWDEWLARPPADYDTTVRPFLTTLRGPSALLYSAQPGACWLATIVAQPAGAEPPRETDTVAAQQLTTLNHLFARYRVAALRLSLAGLGLLGASVLLLYGARRGWRIFALPCGACLFAFGVFGLLGAPLNLFHLLGAFLGVCLSHNYAIFSAENAARGDAPPASIRLSALTTATSFGVLACSRIPVIAALGQTVALIVLVALAIVELLPALRRPASPAP